MTTEAITHPNAPATSAITRPAAPPGAFLVSAEVARRALLKYFRTPGLSVMGVVTSVLFLFSFRFVFGGAVQGGASRYADFFVPGYVATIVLFTGAGIAVAVAEDRAAGFTGRLLSLPVPRARRVDQRPRPGPGLVGAADRRVHADRRAALPAWLTGRAGALRSTRPPP